MLRIKQHKFIWFGIILLGVILIGIPAAVYADDEQPLPVPVEDEANIDQDNYDGDSSDPSKTLGGLTEDFVFTPVNPCRIIDTRNAGGPIGSGSSRSFRVHGNVSGQGGYSGGCPSPVGTPMAVLMNIVAVGSTAPGYLTVWPYGTPRPKAGVINYSPTDKTDPVSNAFTVKTHSGNPEVVFPHIYIYARSQTHVVADVMGYYDRPERTPVETTVRTVTTTISAYGVGGAVATCPATYTVTGGGCHFNIYSSSLVINGSRPFNNGWRCDVINRLGSSQGLNVHAVCTRVPGRAPSW